MLNCIDWIDRLAKGSWLNTLLTFVAGASMIAAFAPFSLWYLIFPGLLFYILPLQSLTIKQTFYRGLWFNIGFYGAGVSWVHVSIHRFGHAPLFLSVSLTLIFIVLLSLFATFSGVLLNRYFSHLSIKYYFLAGFPFCWILFEWFRSWFFTGFPWLNLGHSQIDSYLSSAAPLMGSAAVSFLIVLIVGLIAVSIREGIKGARFSAIILFIILISISYLQQFEWVKVTDKTLSVSLIQPNIPQQIKWQREQRGQTLQYFQQLTETLDSQLIVWPEAAIPALAQSVSNYLSIIDNATGLKSQAVLTGIPVRDGDRLYNAAIMLGDGKGKYYKQHLVPFGEYVPLEAQLRGLIELFDLPMSSFSSGSNNQPPLTLADWNIGMALCYEIIFQDIVANQITGANLLVTLSNDAWFGDSIGPYQHLEIARMRALENGIPLIRATNDGISALIDHQGKITGKLGKFEQGVLSGTITAVSGKTLYRQLGPLWSYFILMLIPGLILIIGVFRYRREKIIG